MKKQIMHTDFGAYLVALGKQMIRREVSAQDFIFSNPDEALLEGMMENGVDGSHALFVIETCKNFGRALATPVVDLVKPTVAIIHCSHASAVRIHSDYDKHFDITFFGDKCRFGELESVCKEYDIIFMQKDSIGALPSLKYEMCKTLAGDKFHPIIGGLSGLLQSLSEFVPSS